MFVCIIICHIAMATKHIIFCHILETGFIQKVESQIQEHSNVNNGSYRKNNRHSVLLRAEVI